MITTKLIAPFIQYIHGFPTIWLGCFLSSLTSLDRLSSPEDILFLQCKIIYKDCDFAIKTLANHKKSYKIVSMVRQIIKFGQVSENRKARFAYSIEDTIEAGISLTGAEIKSIRYGLVTIVDGFVQRRGNNLFLAGVEIQKLPTAARIVNFDERRQRQLLLHRNQINRLIGKLQEKGATIVPLKLYFNNRGKLKVLLGIGYGKNKVDKRETIKQREWERNKSRIMKG